MNPDTMQIKELTPLAAMPEGFVKLPDELQPAAKSLVAWATKERRAKRKQERQNRRRGRK